MVQLNMPFSAHQPVVGLVRCQHAYVLVGHETVHAVHMPRFGDEAHEHQQILRRAHHPDDTSVPYSNHEDALAVPELATGARGSFRGAIHHGIRPPPKHPSEHFFPWSRDRVFPMIENVTATVDRPMLFRPFSRSEPERSNHLPCGKGEEAPMCRLQTARCLTGPFEMPLYGVDVDHVPSFAGGRAGLPGSARGHGVGHAGLAAHCAAPRRAGPCVHHRRAALPARRRPAHGPPRRRALSMVSAAPCRLRGGAVSNSAGITPPPEETSPRMT